MKNHRFADCQKIAEEDVAPAVSACTCSGTVNGSGIEMRSFGSL
jgi:hypothetical protein